MSIFADKFPGIDTGAKISTAIASLPFTGGIVDATRIPRKSIPNDPDKTDIHDTILVDRPVRLLLGAVDYTTSADPVFRVKANFSLIGVDRKATGLLAKNGGKIFELIGTWPDNGTGSPYFSIERMCLIGNGKSCIFDTTHTPDPPANPLIFNEGTIRVEDNLIKNFKSVALSFGKSVYYGMIRNNYFDNNYSSLYFEYGCDSHVLYNRFLPDPSSAAGPQIVVVAPNVRIIGNDFFGSDNSSQPDVLLKPIGASTDGGWGWIVDNKFGAERETFNPKRSRIAVTTIPKDYPVESYIPESVPQPLVSGPTTIRGNHFLGPGVLYILSISRVDKQVYIITEPRHGIPIGENASFNIFIYHDDAHSSFNGTFTVTAINGMTLTYLQEASNHEIFHKIGSAVVLSTGKKLVICGRSRSNNWVTIVTTSPHDIPIPTKDNVKIEITGDPTFSGTFEATSINEMTLSYQNEGSDAEISWFAGYAALTNGKAILLDYYIDNWDISHNLFYHYGILVDDEMEPLIPNPANPSIFKHNRVISLDGINYKILKNNRIQFN